MWIMMLFPPLSKRQIDPKNYRFWPHTKFDNDVERVWGQFKSQVFERITVVNSSFLCAEGSVEVILGRKS